MKEKFTTKTAPTPYRDSPGVRMGLIVGRVIGYLLWVCIALIVLALTYRALIFILGVGCQ